MRKADYTRLTYDLTLGWGEGAGPGQSGDGLYQRAGAGAGRQCNVHASQGRTENHKHVEKGQRRDRAFGRQNYGCASIAGMRERPSILVTLSLFVTMLVAAAVLPFGGITAVR
jgi:hypothetical protein